MISRVALRACSLSIVALSLAVSGCTTLTGKSSPAVASVAPAGAAVPIEADIQQILTQNGIDPAAATAATSTPVTAAPAAPTSTAVAPSAPPVGVLETPIEISALPEAPPVLSADLNAPGASASSSFQFPTNGSLATSDSFGAGFLPMAPPAPEQIVVITGPDAVSIPERKSVPKKAPPAPTCDELLAAGKGLPEACKTGEAGPGWVSPAAVATNVDTPAAPVKRF